MFNTNTHMASAQYNANTQRVSPASRKLIAQWTPKLHHNDAYQRQTAAYLLSQIQQDDPQVVAIELRHRDTPVFLTEDDRDIFTQRAVPKAPTGIRIRVLGGVTCA